MVVWLGATGPLRSVLSVFFHCGAVPFGAKKPARAARFLTTGRSERRVDGIVVGRSTVAGNGVSRAPSCVGIEEVLGPGCWMPGVVPPSRFAASGKDSEVLVPGACSKAPFHQVLARAVCSRML